MSIKKQNCYSIKFQSYNTSTVFSCKETVLNMHVGISDLLISISAGIVVHHQKKNKNNTCRCTSKWSTFENVLSHHLEPDKVTSSFQIYAVVWWWRKSAEPTSEHPRVHRRQEQMQMKSSSSGAPVAHRSSLNWRNRLLWCERVSLQTHPDWPFQGLPGGPGMWWSVVPEKGSSPAPCQTAGTEVF